MTSPIDETHDPLAMSWVESANREGADFPIQNLPHGVFRRRGSNEAFRGGVAIGDVILDLAAVAEVGGLGELAAEALAAAKLSSLNALMQLGQAHWLRLRHALFAALKAGSPDAARLRSALIPQADAEYDLPAVIGDFTDFYASLHHATLAGAMMRPDNPLLPNYKWVPVAYHGRSSSIGVSGQTFPRPVGQSRMGEATAPTVGPSVRLDYELELGLFVGPGNAIGRPIPAAQADAHVFGVCILNDWSARDIQAWEYQPLGPFLGKNFATTVSPWVVTLAALAPFRMALERPPGDPLPLPHLALNGAWDALDIHLDVALQSEAMGTAGIEPYIVAQSNARYAYWTFSQMIAHHTSNGCNLRPGDLIGTGTLSGPAEGQLGSMLEVTRGGKAPIHLPTGEERRFIADGDTIVMRAWCTRDGAKRIGFGACIGAVLPAATP